MIREALAIREAKLGPSHPETGGALDRLGNILLTRGKLDEAVAVQERAVRILREAAGEVHVNTGSAVARLASVQWRRGDVPEALRL